MSEDLKTLNIAFERFINTFKKKPDKKHKVELYMAFLLGYKEGSGMTQVVA